MSRCQKAMLEASPPVLEETLVWLPNALQACKPRGGVHFSGAGGGTVVVQQRVVDRRTLLRLLGVLWQTAQVSAPLCVAFCASGCPCETH